MERLTIPDEKIEGGVRRTVIDTRKVKEHAMTIYWALKKYEDTDLSPQEILELKAHMNDGWIPVEDGLPMRTLGEKINESYQKYLVFIDGVDGWDIDIAVYNFWNDKKWREAHDGYGEIENVIAWRPLPEPYRPERREK